MRASSEASAASCRSPSMRLEQAIARLLGYANPSEHWFCSLLRIFIKTEPYREKQSFHSRSRGITGVAVSEVELCRLFLSMTVRA